MSRAGQGMTPPTPHWASRVGAWVGIGASPAALILGAQLAERHDAPMALAAVAVGGTGMLALLAWQGRLGVRPPAGEGVSFGELAPRYFDSRAARVIAVLLAAAMIGWVGFNAGLGGAALAQLTGLPQAVSSPLVLVGVALSALPGLQWWNWLALVATAASLVLIAIVTASLDPLTNPFTVEAPRRPSSSPTSPPSWVTWRSSRSGRPTSPPGSADAAMWCGRRCCWWASPSGWPRRAWPHGRRRVTWT